jgi:adenylate cyclase
MSDEHKILEIINKFPEQNPNPVFKISRDFKLLYANVASSEIINFWNIKVGDLLPKKVTNKITKKVSNKSSEQFQISTDDKHFSLRVALVEEFDFINIYATDITATRDLELANMENERLLLNILPVKIAERLKKGESTIADKIDNTTVLFADIVGFTTLSTKLSPAEIVNLLGSIFSTFDNIVEKRGIEKIKTIGDSYMAAGGLHKDPNSTKNVALAALDMLEEIKKINEINENNEQKLNLRIGLNTGPVVAGVIGKKKFIFDVWGDTVNTASRMESHGTPGKTQVSEFTYKLLKEDFILESRGEIKIKGKGDEKVYYLKSIK